MIEYDTLQTEIEVFHYQQPCVYKTETELNK